MASTLVQFRTEDTEKLRAVQILDRLGLSLPAYLRMCVKTEPGERYSVQYENRGGNQSRYPCSSKGQSDRRRIWHLGYDS